MRMLYAPDPRNRPPKRSSLIPSSNSSTPNTATSTSEVNLPNPQNNSTQSESSPPASQRLSSAAPANSAPFSAQNRLKRLKQPANDKKAARTEPANTKPDKPFEPQPEPEEEEIPDISEEERSEIDELYELNARKIKENMQKLERGEEVDTRGDAPDSPFERWLSQGKGYNPNAHARPTAVTASAAPLPTPTAATPPTPPEAAAPAPSRPDREAAPPPEPALPPENGQPPSETEPERHYASETEMEPTFAAAILRYGTPGQPEYDPTYNPDNPEYADMSGLRRRKLIKRILITDGKLSGIAPPRDPSQWPSSIDPNDRSSKHSHGYREGSRKGIGNPYGNPAKSEHPEGLKIYQAWVELFEYNEAAAPHNKLADEDVAVIMSDLFPMQRERDEEDVRRARSHYNNGLLRNQLKIPESKLERFRRELADPEDPSAGYEVFLVSQKDKPRLCITNPDHPLNHPNVAPPKPGEYRPRAEFPFPDHAPMWFKWLDGRIVTPAAYKQAMFKRQKERWEAEHPGEAFELEPFED